MEHHDGICEGDKGGHKYKDTEKATGRTNTWNISVNTSQFTLTIMN